MKALVTGGSRGIGRAITKDLLKAGWEVCFTYNRSEDEAVSLASLGALPIRADLSTAEGCNHVCGEASRLLGHVNLLVNNAGISAQKLFTDITDEEWSQMVAVNLTAPFMMTRGLLPAMISRKYGRIINISSMWGVCGASCEVHYSAVKAGLIGMTKALAAELAPSGITVNAIAPGVIDTDMFKMLGEETMGLVRDDIPVGRVGTPEDISRAVLFLADEKASFITGQIIGVNGGMVI